MRRLAKYTKPEFSIGTTRLKRVFAFLPVYVGGYVVWLENYEILQGYIQQQYKVRVDGADKAFAVSSWVDLDMRIVVKPKRDV